MIESKKQQSVGGYSPEFVFGGALTTPSRLAYGLVPLYQLLDDRGEPPDDCLAFAEIPRFALEEPSYRISLEQELTFTKAALERLGYDVGLEVGRRFHLSMFGVLGLAAACATTLRQSFHLLLSYPALAWGVLEITVWRNENNEYVLFSESDMDNRLAGYFVERDMAALLTLFRNTLGYSINPQSVSLRRDPPAHSAGHEDYFGCPVSFGELEDAMAFECAIWDAPPSQANEMSCSFFENQCRSLTEEMHNQFSYAAAVRSRLRHATPMPTLPELASSLHLTARTLQRRLAREGQSFTSLLREVREWRAKELIQHPELHINDIAYRLGFQEPDAFSRAFRSWTGMAPSDYRRK